MATRPETVVPRYRDLDLSFIPHPVTKDVGVKTAEQAVIQSLRNLIMTSFYERPFHPEIGSGIKKLLFENIDPLTAHQIKKEVELVVKNFEPRVRLTDVVVQSTPDHNRFGVSMSFYIVGQPEPTVTRLFLERVR